MSELKINRPTEPAKLSCTPSNKPKMDSSMPSTSMNTYIKEENEVTFNQAREHVPLIKKFDRDREIPSVVRTDSFHQSISEKLQCLENRNSALENMVSGLAIKIPEVENLYNQNFTSQPGTHQQITNVSNETTKHFKLLENNMAPSNDMDLKDNVSLALPQRPISDPAIVLTKIHILNSLVPYKFNGNKECFPIFRNHIKTHLEDGVLPESERCVFLSKFLEGEALRVFQANVGLSYKDAVDLLERRFGNSAAVTEAWVRRLTEGSNIAISCPSAMLDFAEDLTTATRVLSSDALTEISTKICLKKIVARLPQKYLPQWINISDSKNGKETLFDLAAFVSSIARSLNHPVYETKTNQGQNRSATGLNTKKITSQASCRNVTSSLPKSDSSSSVSIHRNTSTTPSKAVPRTSSQSISIKQSNPVEGKPPQYCLFCKLEHSVKDCTALSQESSDNIRNFVQKEGLCFSCLIPKHMSKDCKNRAVCKIDGCGRRHPTSLHYYRSQGSNKEEAKSVARIASNQNAGTYSFIVPVYIHHKDNPDKEILTYALLDDGSDSCYITNTLYHQLGARGERTTIHLSTIHTQTVEITDKISGLNISSFDRRTTIALPSDTYTRDEIPSSREEIPSQQAAELFDHLKNIQNKLYPLLDGVDVHLLIGNNCPAALCPISSVRGEPFEPYGVESALGWGIIGPRSPNKQHRYSCCHVTVKEIINMFDIDTSPRSTTNTPEQGLSINDKLFIKKIENGLRQLENGHYEMPLPLVDDNVKLPVNRSMAVQRLNSLRRKFKNSKFKEDYVQYMNSMFENGYVEEVKTDRDDGRLWYLSHHGVYHPKKPNKIRVVFDCSAKFHGTSLNDKLISSPDLTNSLLGVLFRFRQEKVAFVGDIDGMFLQVAVTEDYRDLLRFLWWEDGDETKQPKEYRMKVHLFGAASSPGCANYALRRTATDHGPSISEIGTHFILHNFYVDDGCGSCATEEEAIQLIKDVKTICAKGGFRFHKLLSTHPEVIESISLEDRATGLKDFTENKTLPLERALGISWCVDSDHFQFRVTISSKPFTRKGLLSTICSAYDPLGFVAPFIVNGKIILQNLQRETSDRKWDWDDPIPDDIVPKWERWLSDLKQISDAEITVPRCYKPPNMHTLEAIELHHFSDASSYGYGHVSYLRFLYDNGKVHCSFLFGKARVRSMKEITIPRLELTAAASVAQASSMIKKELDYQVQRYFWTDSRVVLGYIKNVKKRFQIFVANKIQTIHDCSKPEMWYYVSTKENPADIASRGLSVHELKNSRWLTGPEFLWRLDLPCRNENFPLSFDDPEIKNESKVRAVRSKTNFDICSHFDTFSKWSSLRRGVAGAIRLTEMLRRRKHSEDCRDIVLRDNPFTPTELEAAEKIILKRYQEKEFSEEIEELKKGATSVNKSSRLLTLNPIRGDDELLRVGGRIKRSLLSSEQIHPIIIPKSSQLGTMIARHCHGLVHHQGRGLTLNEIRSQGFWIIGASNLVSQIIRSCVECRKMRGSFQEQKMSDLPLDRITPAPPFSYSVADVFGPFYVKQGRSQVKRYGIIYTCLVSRAVHVDTIDSLDTSSFLNSLRRFLCRRGNIRLLRTDLGTNFVGGKEELLKASSEIDHSEITRFLAGRSCSFEFKLNPAKASHMHGAVERLVGSVRRILDHLLRGHRGLVTEDKLRTLLTECESTINSRPLTVQNLNDPLSLPPLTPNHLLLLKSPVTPPPGVFEEEDLYSRKRWRRVQQLAQEFWTRWKTEYLSILQQRTKWTSPKRNLQIGDVVICRDNNQPRNQWPIALVVQATPSEDGFVRRVSLRFPKGNILERPVTSVVLLVPVQDV